MTERAAHRILHAGLHKTGSTFLQRYVFPKMNGITYLHGYSFSKIPHIPRTTKAPILISSERACGLPTPEASEFHIETLLANVRLLGISRVLLFTDNFNEWILSLYFLTLNETYSWSIEEFVDHNASALLTWKDVGEQAAAALSKEGVGFLGVQQEALLQNPADTISRICAFIGAENIQVHPQTSNRSRMGTATIKTYRILNRTYRFRPFKAIRRTGLISPRKLIQRGRLGAITENFSKRRISAAYIDKLLS